MGNRYHNALKGRLNLLSALTFAGCMLLQNMLMAALPPVVLNQTFEIEENASAGAFVGIIEAIAADITDETPLTFELSVGQDAAAFQINEATGELTVSGEQVLDFELKPTLSLTVIVSQGAESSEALITIELIDVKVPLATTGEPLVVAATEAIVSASFSEAASGGFAAIQYGKNVSLENNFDPEAADNSRQIEGGEESVSLEFQLTELEDAQTYYYRVVVGNSEGTSFGEIKSFTTLSIPWVEKITLLDNNPTTSEEVNFLVVFTEPVNLLSVDDFELELQTEEGGSGELLASINEVFPYVEGEEGTQYVVNVNNISGDGTLKLIFRDFDTVESTEGVKTGGEGIGNADFEASEIYTIDNTPPSVYPLVYTSEDVAVSYSFSVSDAPNNPDDLIVSFESTNTTLVPNDSYLVEGAGENRKIKIIPALHQHGETVVTIEVMDDAGNNSSHQIKLKIVVRAAADTPRLMVEDVSGLEDHDIALDLAAHLVDQDGSEELIHIKIIGVPEGATLSAGTLGENGTYHFMGIAELEGLTFRPKQDEFGTFPLIFNAKASEKDNRSDFVTKAIAMETKTFEVEVLPVNDAPAFELSTNKTEKDEDFSETVEITLTDQSPENETEPITYSLDPASVDFAHLSINEETGTITITAKKDAYGSGLVTVIADDGQAENNRFEETFELIIHSVNDAPVFSLNPESLELEEDFTETHYVEINPGLVPENEASQQVQYAVAVKDGTEAIADVQIVEKDGRQQLEINAIANANGNQVLVITAEEQIDEAESNRTYTQEFTLDISPVNDAPAFSLSPESLELTEDFEGPRYVDLTTLPVPEDEQTQDVSYSVTVKDGDNPIADLEVVEEEGALKLKITSIADANGEQVFEVKANDGEDDFIREFTLKVEAVNDLPLFSITPENLDLEEDFTETYYVEINPEAVPADEAGQEVNYGVTVLNGGSPLANLQIIDKDGKKQLEITAIADRNGSQVLQITAEENIPATEPNRTHAVEFTLTIDAINDAPAFSLNREAVIVQQDFTSTEEVVPTLLTPFAWGEEEEEVTFSLRNAEVDFAQLTIDAQTGKVTITSVPEKYGEHNIQLVATDNGHPAPAEFVKTFLLKVIPANNPPVLSGKLQNQSTPEDELYEFTIPAGIFTDADGNDDLEFSATLAGGQALPEWLLFEGTTKTFSGTPEGEDVGDYSIEVTARDSEGDVIRDSYTLMVVAVNDAPEISEIEDVSMKLGSVTPATVTFTVSDEETAGEHLIVTVESGNTILLPASAISITKEGNERTLTFNPPGIEMLGSSDITVRVSDGAYSAEEHFLFTVEYAQLDLDIPNLITPNNDQKNDTWNIQYLSLYENNEVKIFDRDGREVFAATDYNNTREWDGTHNGVEVPEGIYLYEIRLNGGTIVKRGMLTVAR